MRGKKQRPATSDPNFRLVGNEMGFNKCHGGFQLSGFVGYPRAFR
jgi:hypothetical protein